MQFTITEHSSDIMGPLQGLSRGYAQHGPLKQDHDTDRQQVAYRLSSSLPNDVQNTLAGGVLVRIVLITPAGAAMTMAAFRSPDTDTGQLQEFLHNNLDTLNRLHTDHPGLQVRLIDYLPPYTLYAYDPGLPAGRMDLRLASFHGDYDLRPTFSVQRARDGD